MEEPGELPSMGSHRVGSDLAAAAAARLVIAFLPRSKRLLISWLQSPSSVILEPPKKKPYYNIAKSLQSCPTLCDPIDGSPPGSPIPGILQARTLEWVAISFSSA